ncbi:hypothetical protein Acr_26g0003100 [Actinidia rufa]|uniref:Uncharacterized protein n=1 Tax=Actinidia rufa TaxID=165716 RepID=A0A7J0H1Q4_9ERIC|nr:hypothetical protein Acr_26g0003100 [Actinidia rufa]
MVRMDSRGDGELKGAGREWIRLLAVEVSDSSQNGIGLHVWVPATDRRHGKYRGTPDVEGNTLVVVGGDLVVAGGSMVAAGEERGGEKGLGVPEAGGEGVCVGGGEDGVGGERDRLTGKGRRLHA